MVSRPLAFYYGWWGANLPRARLLGLDSFHPLAEEKKADPALVACWLLSEACLHLRLGCAEACMETVDRGLAILAELDVRTWEPLFLSLQSWAAMAKGDLVAAERAIDRMVGHASMPRLALCLYHSSAGILARRRGDVPTADLHGRVSVGLALASGMPLAEVLCRFAGALSEAPAVMQTELERGLALGRQCGSTSMTSQGLLALALAAMRRGDDAEAAERLREGFGLAQDAGLLEATLLRPDELAECCAFALERGTEPQHVSELVRTLALVPGERAAALKSWPWSLRIEALGGFAFQQEGERMQPCVQGRTRPIETLKLLVIHGTCGLRQEQLMEALWPDADGDAAHQALGTTLYRPRKLLGRGDVVVQRSGRVALDPRLVFVDAWAMERLLCEAETVQPGDANAAGRIEALRSQLRELYRGDLFGQAGTRPPFAEARARLRERTSKWIALT